MKPPMPEREVIVSSLLYLLTRYAQNAEKHIANAICDHLEMLHKHPEISDGCLFNTCERLHRYWRKVGDSNVNSNKVDSIEKFTQDQHFH